MAAAVLAETGVQQYQISENFNGPTTTVYVDRSTHDQEASISQSSGQTITGFQASAQSSSLRTLEHLIVSPYLTTAHLLDPNTLSTFDQLLVQTLQGLNPLIPNYATSPYTNAFNWAEIFNERLPHLLSTSHHDLPPANRTTSLYCVFFRSTLKPTADRALLSQLDRESHAEAIASGGLLKYWFGTCDDEGRNLATCLWSSKEDAMRGGRGPWHSRARRSAGALYESIEFGRIWLTVTITEAKMVEWSFEALKE